MPIAALHADRGSTWALDSLHEILRTMAADLVLPARAGLRLGSDRITAESVLERADFLSVLETSATAFLDYVASKRIS